MALSNEQFIASIQASGTLPIEVIMRLKELVGEAQGKAQPRHLAKWLVDNGHLTQFQAKELLAGRMHSPASVGVVEEDIGLAPAGDVEEDLEVVEDSRPSMATAHTVAMDPLAEVPSPFVAKGPVPPPQGAWSPLPPPGAPVVHLPPQSPPRPAPAPTPSPGAVPLGAAPPGAAPPQPGAAPPRPAPPAPQPGFPPAGAAPYAPAAPGFGAPPSGFGAPPAGFNAPPSGFNAPSAGFGAPPPNGGLGPMPSGAPGPMPGPSMGSPALDPLAAMSAGMSGGMGMGAPAMNPMGMPGMAGPQPAAQPAGAARKLQKGGRKKTRKKAAWDSPFFMLGGGALILLVIFAGFVLWRLQRGNGDEALQAAETEYGKNSFAQAVNLYDVYLKNFPKHKSVGIARVHRGLARMRLATEGTSDWNKALSTCTEILSEIELEDPHDFKEADGELAAILPKIAEGLRVAARQKPTQETVDNGYAALRLIEKYVPKSLRPVEAMQDIEKALGLATRELERTKLRDEGLQKILAAVEAGDTPGAYAFRNDLLRQYPDLESDPGLREAVLKVSQAQRSQVQTVAETATAVEGDRPSIIASETVLAPRVGSSADGIENGRQIYILAEGSAYALEATTGKVLWRRYVGFDATFQPQPLGAVVGGDVLLVDAAHQEIVRVDSATGAARWRYPLKEPIVDGPVQLRGRALVPLRTGQLVMLDIDSGNALGSVRLPQSLRVPPVVDSQQRHYYQVGEHSSLFVLAADNNACDDVFYLGHQKGTIVTAPLLMGPWLIVAENSGVSSGRIRVLQANENGLDLREVQQIPLEGHVLTPPIASGRNLMVVTDRGAVYLFEANVQGEATPLVKIADKAVAEGRTLARFLQLRGAHFWVGDSQLVKYEIQSAQGKLSPRWIKYERDTTLARPQVMGDFLICSRRRAAAPGVAVSAVRIDDGTPIWQTQLGAALAAPPIVEGKNLALLTGGGDFFQWQPDFSQPRQVADKPAAAVDGKLTSLAEASGAAAPGGLFAYSAAGSGQKLLVYEPSAGKKLRWATIAGEQIGLMASFQEKLLIPTKEGQVLLVDAATGKNAVEPFVPRVEATGARPMVALAVSADAAFVADSVNKLYKLAVQKTPAPHLASQVEIDLGSRINTALALAGDRLYAGDIDNQMQSFQQKDLSRGGPLPLDGRLRWGPAAAGEWVFWQTETGRLTCVKDGTLAWEATTDGKLPVGSPVLVNGRIVMAVGRGDDAALVMRSPETGEIVKTAPLNRPLGSGPLVVDGGLALAGHDGAVYLVPMDALQD